MFFNTLVWSQLSAEQSCPYSFFLPLGFHVIFMPVIVQGMLLNKEETGDETMTDFGRRWRFKAVGVILWFVSIKNLKWKYVDDRKKIRHNKDSHAGIKSDLTGNWMVTDKNILEMFEWLKLKKMNKEIAMMSCCRLGFLKRAASRVLTSYHTLETKKTKYKDEGQKEKVKKSWWMKKKKGK